jgi:ribonuclease HII
MCPDLLRYERALWRQHVQNIAGVDEAGRGPLAGPVVAAAVIFSAHQTLIQSINDSKKLTARQREKAFVLIHEHALAIGIGIVAEDEIDRLNILQATYQAMLKAVQNLTLQPEHLLIDGNGKPETFLPVTTLIKGDGLSMSIAAASIIAKVTRDRLMHQYHELYPQYRFDKHKGYPTAIHIQAIREWGWCPIHRRSFHPKKLQDMLP